MLTIRLQRTGRENTPTYRIVVAEHSNPVKGKFLEIVGHYLPARDPKVLEHNEERISYWVGKGAIPSDTVARILSKKGMKQLDKFVKRYAKQRSKKEQPAEAPAAAPAPKVEAAAPAPAQPLASDVPPAAEEAPKETGDTEKKEG